MLNDKNPTADLHRLPRNAMDINVLRTVSGHADISELLLTDPATQQTLTDAVSQAFRQGLNKPSALYGMIAQAMFASMVASLGWVQLIKEEDIGEAFSVNEIVVPDYFVVLRDGTRALIEVKSVNENPTKHDFTLSKGNLDALKAFAALYGVELYVAVFWVKINKWTLVPADAFQAGTGNRARLPFGRAMSANHMRLLGDIMVGTEFPLSWVLTVDEQSQAREGNQFLLTITGDFWESKGRRISDPVERGIAWYLAYYGDWDTQGAEAQFEGDRLVRIETALYPQGPNEILEEQGFAFIGSLSSMFSKFYRDAVTDEQGNITRLNLETTPGFLGRLVPEPYTGKALKLWRMEQKPSWPDEPDTQP